jgi:competence protein ComEA
MMGLTPDERKAVIFLMAVFLAGTAILAYKRIHPSFAPGLKAVISELPSPDTSGTIGAQMLTPQDAGVEKSHGMARQDEKYFGSRRVNINQASQQALEKLPNIGPAMAKRIIDYRQSRGGFKSVGELKKVKGIGAKRLSQLVDHVSVE